MVLSFWLRMIRLKNDVKDDSSERTSRSIADQVHFERQSWFDLSPRFYRHIFSSSSSSIRLSALEEQVDGAGRWKSSELHAPRAAVVVIAFYLVILIRRAACIPSPFSGHIHRLTDIQHKYLGHWSLVDNTTISLF